MANINPEINALRTSVYGEDIRKALIDIVNDVNTESTNAITAANNALTFRSTLTSSYNLNSVDITGSYDVNSNSLPTNYPSTNSGVVLVFNTSSYITQMVITDTIYYRVKASSWSDWIDIQENASYSEMGGILPDNTDINGIHDNSVYYLAASYTYTNTPINGEMGILYSVNTNTGGGHGCQYVIYASRNTNASMLDIYFRLYVGGYKNWTHLSNDYSSKSVNKYTIMDGYIKDGGVIGTPTNALKQCMTERLSDVDHVYLSSKHGNTQYMIAYYDRVTGAFISRDEWTTGVCEVYNTNHNDIIICFADYNSNHSTKEEVVDDTIIVVEYDKRVYEDALKGLIVPYDVTLGPAPNWSPSLADNCYLHTFIKTTVPNTIVYAKDDYEIALLTKTSHVTITWRTVMNISTPDDYYLLIRKEDQSAFVITDANRCLDNYLIRPALRHVVSDVIGSGTDYSNINCHVIGDSITYGTGASSGHIWHDILNSLAHFNSKTYDGIAGSCYSVTSDYGSTKTPICQRVQNIDSDVNLVLIFAGTNDYGHGTPLGTIADSTDISFYGALNVTLSAVLTNNPSARLILITPLHRYKSSTYDTTPNAQGLILKDYVDAIKTISEYYSIPVIDLFSISGINPGISAINAMYYTDGLHPNDTGHAQIGKVVYKQLTSLV